VQGQAKSTASEVSPLGAAARIAEVERRARIIDVPGKGSSVRWRLWGEGPRLILLHGNGGSWLHWIRNIPPLARRYAVMVPDVPGFGESELPQPPHDYRSLADSLYLSARALVSRDSVAIAGFSMGASIATGLAKQFGQSLRGLVLIGAGGGFGVASTQVKGLRRWRDVSDFEARRQVHRHNVRTLMLGPDATDIDLAEEIQARGNEGTRVRFRREVDGGLLHSVLSGLEAPMAAVWGEEDSIMRGHRAEREDYFGSAGAELTFLPATGHWAQFERPEEIEAVIDATCLFHAFNAASAR